MLKAIDGYDGYYVSDEGYIIGKRGKRIGYITRHGYEWVCLGSGKKQKHAAVHRLVAEYFVEGKTEECCVVDHKDGNKLNNRAENLRWTTLSQNLLFAYHEQQLMPDRQMPKSVVLISPRGTAYFFDSIHEASVQLGLAYWHLNDAYHGRRPKVQGYTVKPCLYCSTRKEKS